MAYLPVDGTAALAAPRVRPALTLLDGGAAARPCASPAATGELSRRQTVAVCLFGVALIGLLALASLVGDGLSRAAAASSIEAMPTESVVVQEGATLWGIAQGRCPEGVSTSELVSWISKENGLGSEALVAGQVIRVPVASQA